MPTIEVAWAAGFFDGEGSVSRVGNRHGQFYLHVQVAQSGDPAKLHRFRNAVGVGKVYGPYKPGEPGRKERYGYHVTGEKAYVVMEALWPYLTGDKIEKFEQLLADGIVPRKVS